MMWSEMLWCENKNYSQICSVKIAGEQDRSVLIVQQTIEENQEMTAVSCVVRLCFYQNTMVNSTTGRLWTKNVDFYFENYRDDHDNYREHSFHFALTNSISCCVNGRDCLVANKWVMLSESLNILFEISTCSLKILFEFSTCSCHPENDIKMFSWARQTKNEGSVVGRRFADNWEWRGQVAVNRTHETDFTFALQPCIATWVIAVIPQMNEMKMDDFSIVGKRLLDCIRRVRYPPLQYVELQQIYMECQVSERRLVILNFEVDEKSSPCCL